MTPDRATPLPHRRPAQRSGGVDRWLRGTGLGPAFEASDAFGVRDVGDGFVAVEWTSLDRTAIQRPARIDVDAAGRPSACARTFVHWSQVPGARSRVIVAPDILTFIALRHACRAESVFPFVMVAPVGGAVPHDWLDPAYWDFERVTLLEDGFAEPSRLVRLLAGRGLAHVGVAGPPDGGTWLRWAMDRERAGYDELAAVEMSALPVAAFDEVRVRRGDAVEWLRRECRGPDSLGRVCRVSEVARPGSAGGRMLLVRSDRTSADLERFAPHLSSGSSAPGWSPRAAAAFLDGAPAPTGEDVGRALRDVLAPIVGGGRALRILSAFVALTYVHQACDELPVVLVRGGSAAARLALRRLLSDVCPGASAAARMRAMQLARILDAGEGVLLLDEPGPLSAPSGATEIGRLLADGTVRGASAYTRVSDRHGLRTLDVFGPKLILAAAGTTAGLPFSTEMVDLTDGAVALPPAARPDAVRAARDALYAWAMGFHRGIGRGIGAEGLLPLLADALRVEGEMPSPAHPIPDVARSPDPAERSPVEEMDEVMNAVGSGGHVAMIQVMLEIAVRGGDCATFSPERVGRWLSAHPRVDRDRPVERRRLLGQISRIYPLLCDDREPDAATAFRFCLGRVCGDCRYDGVCGSVNPALKERKAAL